MVLSRLLEPGMSRFLGLGMSRLLKRDGREVPTLRESPFLKILIKLDEDFFGFIFLKRLWTKVEVSL